MLSGAFVLYQGRLVAAPTKCLQHTCDWPSRGFFDFQTVSRLKSRSVPESMGSGLTSVFGLLFRIAP